MSDNTGGLVKALAYIAWSDRRVGREEHDMLATVMTALAVPQARREELAREIDRGQPPLDEIAACFDDDLERRFVVAQAILMATADGPMNDHERRDLARLAGVLGIGPEELAFIHTAVDATNEAFPAPPPSFTGR